MSEFLFDDLYSPKLVADLPAVPQVPIAPSADLTAKHCSSMGARKITGSREYLWRLMLKLYAQGPRADAEIAEALGVAPSTISARRAELIAVKKVDEQSCGTRKNPRTGVSNSLWQLKADGNGGW